MSNGHHFYAFFFNLDFGISVSFHLSFSKEYCFINYVKEIIKLGSSLNSCGTQKYSQTKPISEDGKQFFLCVHVSICAFLCVYVRMCTHVCECI